MHIKTGTWDPSSLPCDSDGLCDPTALGEPAASQPHIRNRRLSPGSGGCGGGGGGCPAEPPYAPARAHLLAQRREKERRGLQKGRGQRREGVRTAGRGERASQRPPKERWVEDSLALLRPPPAFPVQDSPAKLLPAVSYASKVKAGPVPLDEEPPAIGVLLQNQWGLSFISEARPPAAPPAQNQSRQASPASSLTSSPAASLTSSPAASSALPALLLAPPGPEEWNQAQRLMLSSPHLLDALEYHSREWGSMCIRQKDSKRVVWYKDTLENPA